jgi:glutaredoxin
MTGSSRPRPLMAPPGWARRGARPAARALDSHAVAATRTHSEGAVVTLYGRPGCHLCELARAALLGVEAIELREVDIETDDRLLAEYLERIPVVELRGRIISELEFDSDAFEAALAHTVGP